MMQAAALTLPRLGAARPRYAVNSCDATAAKAVLALHKAKRFDPGALHPARAFPGALALIEGAFTRWISTVQQAFDGVSFRVGVGVGAGSMIDDWDTVRAAAAGEILQIVIGNRLDDPFGATWILKRRYQAIEREQPGLARTGLHTLQLAHRHGLPLWTPAIALDAASWAYWAGCDDEREYLAQMRIEGEDPDDIEIFRRADFDAAIPAEVSHPKQVLKRAVLDRLSIDARRRPKVARIAALCLEIRAACLNDAKRTDYREFIPDAMHETARLHHVACVRWSADDPMYRIFDDWANPAYEAGEALEAYGWHEVPIEPAAITAWFAGVERGFRIAALGQQLLALIAERES